MEEEKNEGLEESMKALKKIVEELETGDHTLEESFEYYRQGMNLVEKVSGQIDRVEKKCLILQEGGQLNEL